MLAVNVMSSDSWGICLFFKKYADDAVDGVLGISLV